MLFKSLEIACAKTRRFEYAQGTSCKFWEITVLDKSYTVRYGRIGSEGTTLTKHFKTRVAGDVAAQRMIRSKLKKGYKEVE